MKVPAVRPKQTKSILSSLPSRGPLGSRHERSARIAVAVLTPIETSTVMLRNPEHPSMAIKRVLFQAFLQASSSPSSSSSSCHHHLHTDVKSALSRGWGLNHCWRCIGGCWYNLGTVWGNTASHPHSPHHTGCRPARRAAISNLNGGIPFSGAPTQTQEPIILQNSSKIQVKWSKGRTGKGTKWPKCISFNDNGDSLMRLGLRRRMRPYIRVPSNPNTKL